MTILEIFRRSASVDYVREWAILMPANLSTQLMEMCVMNFRALEAIVVISIHWRPQLVLSRFYFVVKIIVLNDFGCGKCAMVKLICYFPLNHWWMRKQKNDWLFKQFNVPNNFFRHLSLRTQIWLIYLIFHMIVIEWVCLL